MTARQRLFDRSVGQPHVDTPRPLRVHFNCHGAIQLSSQSSRKVRSICRGAVCAKRVGATLGQFHVTICVTNPRSAHIATEAMLDLTLIARRSDTGEDVDIVIGFDRAIEEVANAVPRCWRMTILEAEN